MTVAVLIAGLARRGVRLSARTGKLLVDAPTGVLTPVDLGVMRENKAALLAALPDSPAIWPDGWREEYEARADALEFDAGMPRDDAERKSARETAERMRLPGAIPLPWRPRLEFWSDRRRQLWGYASMRLEDAGVPWPESERLAFEEVRDADLETLPLPPDRGPPPADSAPDPPPVARPPVARPPPAQAMMLPFGGDPLPQHGPYDAHRGEKPRKNTRRGSRRPS
jgi:hypothetical protein